MTTEEYSLTEGAGSESIDDYGPDYSPEYRWVREHEMHLLEVISSW